MKRSYRTLHKHHIIHHIIRCMKLYVKHHMKNCMKMVSISMKRLIILFASGLSILFSYANSYANSRPNFVLIIADDCTYLDMEIYGGQAKTPHIKRLSEEGMKLSRCFQSAPMCSPTRHNLYTGIYPVKSGAWPNHTQVYRGTKSIAHELKSAGYRVALSGKTHIGPRDSFPFEYSSNFKTSDPNAVSPYPFIESFFKDAQDSQTPFCLIACSNEPHTPYTKGDASSYSPDSITLPPTFVDTPETRLQYSKYLAEITFFDEQCGKVIELLEQYELAENTMVMIISEQGSGFPFAKWTCYELGLASAMIVKWQGKIMPKSQSAALVEYCDVAPTFLEAAGIKTPKRMDGISFLPVLLGEKDEHKSYTFGLHTTRGITNGSETFGIRSCGTKRFRYIRNLHPHIRFTNAITRKGGDRADFWSSWLARAKAGDEKARHLIHRYSHRPPEELYDVENDPHCQHNLIGDPELQKVRQTLSKELDKWMISQGDRGAETEAIAHTRSSKYIRKHSRQ